MLAEGHSRAAAATSLRSRSDRATPLHCIKNAKIALQTVLTFPVGLSMPKIYRVAGKKTSGEAADRWETNMALAKIERENAAKRLGCLGKAADDEPVFILRAQDALAAELVELWAIRARAAGCPVDKVREAQNLAEEMLRWPVRKYPD